MIIIFGNTLSLYDYFGKYVSEDVDVLSANVTEQQMPFKKSVIHINLILSLWCSTILWPCILCQSFKACSSGYQLFRILRYKPVYPVEMVWSKLIKMMIQNKKFIYFPLTHGIMHHLTRSPVNCLLPDQKRGILWTTAELLSIRHMGNLNQDAIIVIREMHLIKQSNTGLPQHLSVLNHHEKQDERGLMCIIWSIVSPE